MEMYITVLWCLKFLYYDIERKITSYVRKMYKYAIKFLYNIINT